MVIVPVFLLAAGLAVFFLDGVSAPAVIFGLVAVVFFSSLPWVVVAVADRAGRVEKKPEGAVVVREFEETPR
jgi:hypothetical protein